MHMPLQCSLLLLKNTSKCVSFCDHAVKNTNKTVMIHHWLDTIRNQWNNRFFLGVSVILERDSAIVLIIQSHWRSRQWFTGGFRELYATDAKYLIIIIIP